MDNNCCHWSGINTKISYCCHCLRVRTKAFLLLSMTFLWKTSMAFQLISLLLDCVSDTLQCLRPHFDCDTVLMHMRLLRQAYQPQNSMLWRRILPDDDNEDDLMPGSRCKAIPGIVNIDTVSGSLCTLGPIELKNACFMPSAAEVRDLA